MCHRTNINIYSGMVIFFPETPMLPDMNLNATFWTMQNAKNATFWHFQEKLWITLLKTQKRAENDCAPKNRHKKIKAGSLDFFKRKI